MKGHKKMIRFCDRKEYIIHLGDMSRSQMLHFFTSDNHEHVSDIITIVDQNNKFYGIVTYQRILKYTQKDTVISRDNLKLVNADTFWKDAKVYFKNNPEELLPVTNAMGEILGFCYDHNHEYYYDLERCLENFDKKEKLLPVPFSKWKKQCHAVCITDINELAWMSYKLFKKMGYPVIVIGAKWEWFGLKTMIGYNDYPDYAKMYLYAEGTQNFRERIDEFWKYNSSLNQQFHKVYYGWATANMKEIYHTAVQNLVRKGVSVCVARLPRKKDVSYYTELEKDALLCPSDKILEKIVGKEILEKKAEGKLTDYHHDYCRRLDFRDNYGECLDHPIYFKRIYLVGPCIVMGNMNSKEDTLLSILQNLTIQDEYQIVRISSHWTKFMLEVDINEIPIRKQDIIIFIEGDGILDDITIAPKIDLTKLYNDVSRQTWLYDGGIRHTNKYANQAIAKEIYTKYLKQEIEFKKRLVDGEVYIQKGEVLSEKLREEVLVYVNTIKAAPKISGTAGAIVMNCNPFTLGHQYLAEYAAKRVDILYIFVVEEDRSFFSFRDRIEMVRYGTTHLKNVHVIPSSKWVLSYDTLPIYFEKSKRKEEIADAAMDLEIFARYIAPPLEITIRFIGQEPEDAVTRQYNEQMKRILKDFDILVNEIPRKKQNGKIISASSVRKYMEKNQWENIRTLVPKSTYHYIKDWIINGREINK